MNAQEATRNHLIARVRDDDLDYRTRYEAAYALASGLGYREPKQIVAVVFPLALDGGESVSVDAFDAICDAFHQVEIDAFRARQAKRQEATA